MNQSIDYAQLSNHIKLWGRELGFQQIGISDTDLTQASEFLQQWLGKQYHGEMQYLQRHASLRAQPQQLIPNTQSVICVRLNYLPPNVELFSLLKKRDHAYLSRYALGRDYHKLIRKRLTQLALKIKTEIGDFQYRAFADSAPVMEKPLAVKAGLGWMGKHTNLLHREAGSWFFLGTLYTDLPLPADKPLESHCGKCQACLKICPTQAIVKPYELNASRCISYLTIELRGSIPEELRPLMGNRIYGCDDCQLVCPWNRYAQMTEETDFLPRHHLDNCTLLELFAWDENTFFKKTEGSAIRRIGYACWLRNIAVALGNAPFDEKIIFALTEKKAYDNDLVREHVLWALQQQEQKRLNGDKTWMKQH
ncbi:MAG: tRNA epoxyqueuosine(34) reductase QueG [Legionellales bacterium]|nr:tRNA epoxyqueuosine(34) reductase QueG [Legionellales bacterium]